MARPSRRAPPRTSPAHWLFLAVVLAGLVAAQRDAAHRLSFTFDEPVDLGAGVAAVAHGETRLGPEHAPLPPLLAGLTLRLAGAGEGPRAAAVYAAIAPADAWQVGKQQQYARALLYEDLAAFRVGDARPGAPSLFALARLPMLAFALLLAASTWIWSRWLHGGLGAAISLALLATYPDLLGHMALVASDLPLAACGLATGLLLARLQSRGGAANLLAAGLALAATLAAKLSAAFLVAAMAGTLLVSAAVGPSDPAPAAALHPCGQGSPRARARAIAAAIVLLTLITAAGLSAAYLGRNPLGAYAEALSTVYRNKAPNHRELCLGQLKEWHWNYFPTAFALKAPLGTMTLLLLAVWVALRDVRRRHAWRTELLLHLPAGILLLVTCARAWQIGTRYLLPIMAFGFVSAGRLGPWAAPSPARRALVGLLLGLNLAGNLNDHPFHAAAFNRLAGDPLLRHLLLEDSNVDWGEGLPALAAWQQQEGVTGEQLVVLGRLPWHDQSGLDAYGVQGRAACQGPDQLQELVNPRRGQVYAISTHVLARWTSHERELRAQGTPPLHLLELVEPRRVGVFLIYDLR